MLQIALKDSLPKIISANFFKHKILMGFCFHNIFNRYKSAEIKISYVEVLNVT